MAITASIGFDSAAATEPQWARYLWATGLLQWYHGVASGLAVTPGGGTRQVSVASGTAVVPGVLVESSAAEVLTVGANSGGVNRLDSVVVDVDWAANTAALAVVAGGTSLPTLTQNEGTRWQMPLASITVRPSVTTILTSDIAASAPLPRRTRFYPGSAIAGRTMASGASPVTVSSVTLPDPGWPYVIAFMGALRVMAPSGFARADVNLSGVTAGVNISEPLVSLNGYATVSVAGAVGTYTGTRPVTFTLEPQGVTSGDLLTLNDVTPVNFFGVLQIPA